MANNKIDALDRKIISLLELDASQSSEVLAKQLGVNSSTIRRRIHKLVQAHVIRITAIPDPAKIGYPLSAIIALDIAQDKLNSVLEILSNREEVRWLFATSGRFDALAMVWFASTDSLFSFVEKELSRIEGIKNTETFIVLKAKRRFGKALD